MSKHIRKTLMIGTLGVLLVAAVGMVVARASFKRSHRQLVHTLLGDAQAPTAELPTPMSLPAPIKRYLETVLPADPPIIEAVHLEQTGTFFLNGTWQPFRAVQTDTLEPSGFVWDANIKAGPLLDAKVVDYYVGGEGGLRAKLLGVLTLVNIKGTKEADSGELMRYLAEAPWYPTALLPGNGVTWTLVDDHSATATLIDNGTTISLTFHFNEANEIDLVEGPRYRETDGGAELTPWRGRFWNYAEREGVRVPLNGEVAWVLEGNQEPYWRGKLVSLHYTETETRADETLRLESMGGDL